jgi:hypothetical protein
LSHRDVKNNRNFKEENSMRHLKHLVLASLLFSMVSSAYGGCQSWDEQLMMTGPTPLGPFNGGATVSIGGAAPVSVITASTLLGSVSFDPANPPLSVSRSGNLLFPPGANGSIDMVTARADGVGVPTGPGTFAISASVKFTGGAGKFENTSGKAKMNATATTDLATGFTQFNATVQGKICEY